MDTQVGNYFIPRNLLELQQFFKTHKLNGPSINTRLQKSVDICLKVREMLRAEGIYCRVDLKIAKVDDPFVFYFEGYENVNDKKGRRYIDPVSFLELVRLEVTAENVLTEFDEFCREALILFISLVASRNKK